MKTFGSGIDQMETLIFVIEITAILVFAYSGVIHAHRSGFDLVGVLTIALVTAFGGGTLRDVLLGVHPLYWIEHWQFLVYIMLLAPGAVVLLRYNKDFSSRRSLMIIDALGLGLFTASGVSIALKTKTPLLPAAMIGVVTATFGGVLRDIMCNQKPHLFQPTEPLYATCAFVGAWIYILLIYLNFPPSVALLACVAATFLFRLAAVKYDLKLSF